MSRLIAFGPGLWPAEGAPLSGSPRYHLWGLARLGWDVLYVDPPQRFRPRTQLRDYTLPEEAKGRLRVLSVGMTPPFAVRAAPLGFIGEKWRSWVAQRLSDEAGKAMEDAPRLYWYGAPWHGAIATLHGGIGSSVYHVYDELPLSPIYTDAQSIRLSNWENELLSSVDLCLCSSMQQLAVRQERARSVQLLGNAVKDGFVDSSASEAGRAQLARMEALPRPLFLYGGVADQRLDPDFFTALVREMDARRSGTLIFAGTKSPRLDRSIAALATHPRVCFLGQVAYGDFPTLYRQADTLVLAHRRTRFTDAMYPEKINEYLCTGKPVVSVDLPEVARIAHELPPDGIRLVKTSADFASECFRAAESESASLAEARRSWAARHTWSGEARRLQGILTELLGEDATST